MRCMETPPTSQEDRPAPLVVGLNAVIVAVTDEQPRVLTVSVPEDVPLEGAVRPTADGGGRLLEALPTGPLDPTADRTLELALRRWVRTWAGLELGYVEQLYTFGDRFRDPREHGGGPRVISVAYLALVRESPPSSELPVRWRTVYRCLPWEDWRHRRPVLIDHDIVPALHAWIGSPADGTEAARRRERAAVAFGLDGGPWDGDRVLERYELLYELGLVAETRRDGVPPATPAAPPHDPGAGVPMAFDHRRILATALGRIRAKIRYRPVVFELLPPAFTLLQLQRTVEALAGVRLHKQNFRRLVEQGGLVETTGDVDHRTGGRPAKLFRFRRDVLLERPAPGVGLPARSPAR